MIVLLDPVSRLGRNLVIAHDVRAISAR
jgi:hypothetical protein